MRTKEEVVSTTGYVWARPKSDHMIKLELADVDGDVSKVMPFEYEVTTCSSHWSEQAVQIHEFPIEALVPEGIDLMRAAVTTMQEEIARIRKEADDKIDELQDRINKLALIEHQRKPDGVW